MLTLSSLRSLLSVVCCLQFAISLATCNAFIQKCANVLISGRKMNLCIAFLHTTGNYASTQNRVSLAQLVERRSHNPEVVSSILTGGMLFECCQMCHILFECCQMCRRSPELSRVLTVWKFGIDSFS